MSCRERRLRCTMGTGLVCLAILIGACGTTEPGDPVSRIVFRAFEPEGINLFSVSADGTDLRRLTDDPAQKGSPTWSPDGRFVAFDGTAPPSFKRDIYLMSAVGSGLRKLFSNDSDNFEPEWSPDGSRIAFSSFRVDSQNVVVEEQRIWVMQADGTGRTPLATGSAPSWSPDSRRLVFVRGLEGLNTGLFLIDSDGSGEIALTDPRPAANEDLYPEWSPDGTYIAFTRVQFSSTSSATLMLIRPDGTGLRELTGPLLRAYQPSWSPDGKEIVFNDGTDGQLKVIHLEDPATIRLLGALPGAFNESPEWGAAR